MKKYTCPKCNKRNSVQIVYGYPGKGMMESSLKGEISLGGCIIGRNSPDRYCKTCDTSWISSEVKEDTN